MALAVLGVSLGDGDQVEQVLVGKLNGVDGVAALVGDEVILVNGREWDPEVIRLPVAGLQVQGLQDGRSASLQLQSGATQQTFAGVGDTDLAVEFASRVRQRSSGG